MGKKKIEMEEVQDPNKKQVHFSKRRVGLFKKASELATLCNAEVGIVVFSPGGKPYFFGKPDFDLIAERLKNKSDESDHGETLSGARKEKKMCKRLNSIVKEADDGKKEAEDLQKQLESAEEERLNKSIEELTLEELYELEDKMKNMHAGIQGNINKMKAASDLMFLSNDN